jgi:hypothetical protein
MFATVLLFACGDPQPENITYPTPPYPPEYIPTAPPPHRAPARMQLVIDALGLTIWPVEQPLPFQVFAFDQQGAPTSATPEFARSSGSGLLTTKQVLNSEIGLVAWGLWQLGAPPSISYLDVVVGMNVGASLALEAVHAGTAPDAPVRYALDSIDGRRPPFLFDEGDYFRFQVIGIEAELHKTRYVLRHLVRHPISGVTSSYEEAGNSEWYNGVASFQPDSAYFPARYLDRYNTIAVVARDGRLQIASRSGNVWPPLGSRYDFKIVR